MALDIDKLKETELRKFTFEQTVSVANELEKCNLQSIKGTREYKARVETYYFLARLIYNRICNNEFAKEVKSDKQREKLSAIKFKSIALMADFRHEINTVTLESVSEQLTEENREIQKTVGETKEALTGVKGQIDKFEHTILTHVLTLLGVFSAIITVILSISISSSTWLNNAGAGDAIVAFVVPSLVAVLSVVVLLSLVFGYHREQREDGDKKVPAVRFWLRYGSMFFVVLTTCVAIIVITFSYVQPTHTRYIISPTEFDVCVECDSETKEECSYYKFAVENKVCVFLCDEEYLHDGNLYYCSVHEALE